LESQRLQYELVEKTRQWGFSDVRVIDEDLGLSASASASDKRTGFQNLVMDVTLQKVGIIVAREVSRLARSNADWYRLLDLCGLFDTLIADGDGIYHPNHLNDRMVLGLKGTMSEVELTVLKNRLLDAARNKAKRGELVYRLPIGLVRIDGRIDKDPDLRIQASLDQVFQKFRETQSGRQTLLWFRQDDITFPHIYYESGSRQVVWKVPAYTQIHSILRNPYYAGAYVYGRRTTRTEVRDLKVRKTKGHPLAMSEWKVLIKDHHPGYISWEEFEKNQALIADNFRRHGARGPALCGAALLAGMLRCRRCGRKLSLHYGGKDGTVPTYSCPGDRNQTGGNYCLYFGGLRVDHAVSREVLQAVKPIAIEAALKAVNDMNRESAEQIDLLSLELQQAEYEADRAFRQYNRVDPENRLVASNLESTWNEKLGHVQTIKERIAQTRAGVRVPTKEEQDKLLGIAEDMQYIWTAQSTTAAMRKRIIRAVLEEVVVDVDPTRSKILLDLHWKGGTHTHLEVRKNRLGEHRYCTDQEIVELVRQLSCQLSDKAIVPILNKLGYRTGRGNAWTASRVCSLRHAHGISSFDPEAPRAVLTLQQAARELGISDQSIKVLIQKNVVVGHQIVAYAPWCIPKQEVEKESVRRAAERIRRRLHGSRRFSSRENQTSLFQGNQGF
jgi:DNA invertase Pin-like site-specific DNA recombinase